VDNTDNAIVDYAKQFVGTPYVWGGTNLKEGVDCSGLIQSVYRQFGIELPRVSFQQATAGKRIGLNELKPGDLVAWDNSSRNNGADHIAIYAGNGKIIEAARPGTNVRIRKLGDNEGAWGVRIKR
jgi:cell wall-associated NlpC family hydrolase